MTRLNENIMITYCFNNGATEIFVHISKLNKVGIGTLIDVGYKFYKQDYVIYIAGLGIYRRLKSFIRNPINKGL